MKKTKKALASLAIMGMAATLVPFNAFAATGVTTARLAGSDRVGTAIAVAEKFVSATTAILAPAADANLVDALAAAPLAGKTSPILLTEGATLSPTTKAELVKLGVTKVFVVGAVSQAVFEEVNAMAGVEAVQLKGADRIATAALITAKLTTAPAGTFVVGYNALADALSVASYAAANNYSIVVTNPDGSLPANETLAASNVYIIGGPTLVKDITNAVRLYGTDRFETNKKVLDTLSAGYTFGNVYVSNGTDEHLVDSLSASSLAAKSTAPVVLTNTDVGGDATAVAISAKLANNAVVTALGGSTVVSDATVQKVVTGVVVVPTGTLAVTSVSAVSANSFKVVFSQAPADTAKVTITVTRSTTPVTTTTTFNAAKTEATVTASTNFPEGSYTVAVKNDTTDLGTSTVAITQQKVAKINITSTKLAVTTTGGAIQTGYASYNVKDQYQNDVTTSSLANNIHFQSGVTTGDISAKNGVLKLIPNVPNLMQFATVVITGYDTATGVSTTATLATSTQIGSLSDIQLTTLTNADNKVLTAGDSTSIFYAGYIATDISGNPTDSYDLVKGGLILNNSNLNLPDALITSNSYVTAQVVPDPSDSTKAKIQVQVVNGTVISMDQPVTITAMTWTGKSSALNTTLKKAAIVDTFNLMVPSYDIAQYDSKSIPFVAYDQNGVAITKATELSAPAVVFSSNVTTSAAVDGTLILTFNPQNTGQQTITSMTSTGKYSSININVQNPAYANALTLDTTKLINSMQIGAVQFLDCGGSYGGLAVKDQYGRVMDLQKYTSLYEVVATTSGAINAAGIATGGGAIALTAGATGPGTVTFKLVLKTDPNTATPLDQKSVTMGVVANGDIKGYVMDTVKDPIYTTTSGAITFQDDAYSANPNIYGLTASGSKVVLADSITNAFVDSTDFGIDTVNGVPSAYDSVYVYAKPLANNVTSSSTNLTVVFTGADGAVKSLSTPIKSTTVAPTASTIAVSVATYRAGITVNGVGDTVEITQAAFSSYFENMYMTSFTETGAKNRAGVYFYAKDQYGTKAMDLAQIVVGSTTGTPIVIDANGKITTTNVTIGSTATITGITNNGLLKTIILKIVAN